MSVEKNIVWSPNDYAKMRVAAQEAGEEMLSRLTWMTLKPNVILDMGCGTGEMGALLQERYPSAHLIAIDQSEAMVAHACANAAGSTKKISGVCTNAERLPFNDQSVDLVFANFLLPWHAEIKALLREWRRVLRPQGLLMLNALGPDTLQEWRGHLGHALVPQLIDVHDIGDLLLQENFIEPVLDVSHFTVNYRDKDKLMNELCQTGMLAQQINPLAPLAVDGAEKDWPATYEVIYAHAFVPPGTETAAVDGVAKFPLSHLRRQLR